MRSLSRGLSWVLPLVLAAGAAGAADQVDVRVMVSRISEAPGERSAAARQSISSAVRERSAR